MFSNQSKETAIINNNLMSLNRAFGRDISNLRETEPKSLSSFVLNKDSQSGLSTDTNVNLDIKAIDNLRYDMIDLSLAELPKTTKDPLLASRELLSSKTALEKSNIQTNGKTKCVQKVPMNLFTMENCDILNVSNPQYVSVYAKDIFDHLLAVEEKLYAKYGYLNQSQIDVTDKMRAILIDWLVDIHIKFKLLPETFYLAINLLDRALEKITVTKGKLQLVGITTMFIAAKYQEIYPPDLKDFVHVTDKAYTREDILEMEGRILCMLNFKLTVPSALTFLERYSKIAGMDQKSFYFCQYLLELALLDYRMLKYRPSLLVCGAIHFTHRVFKRQTSEEALHRTTGYTDQMIKLCAKDLFLTVKTIDRSTLKALKRKFLTSQYMEVSNIQIEIF